MKSFQQFLESTAVQQATRMGLVGDGHGGWYDKKGEFIAKTEKGKLKFYNKRQRVGEQDPKQTDKEKKLSQTTYDKEGQSPESAPGSQPAPGPESVPGSQPAPGPESAPSEPPLVQQQQELQPNPRTKGSLTIAFGRFNPPHAGHEKLLNTVASSADDNEYVIVPTKSTGKDTDPLDYRTKVDIMKDMFPDHKDKILDDKDTRTIFDVLKKAHSDGYSSVKLVGGGDRRKLYDQLGNKYNGQLFDFDSVETINAGERDDESDDPIEAMSASVQRNHVLNGDFDAFYAGYFRPVEVIDPETRKPKEELQPIIDEKKAEDIYLKLRKAMKLEDEVKEGVELWRVAPKLDWKGLRENYVNEKIFKIGQLVEDFNTGLIGRIIRRGANHLICVTEDDMMFKSWVKDLSETKKYTEVHMDSKMRDKIHPNNLIGTKGHLKNVKDKVPGSSWGMQFLNKYRKK